MVSELAPLQEGFCFSDDEALHPWLEVGETPWGWPEVPISILSLFFLPPSPFSSEKQPNPELQGTPKPENLRQSE